MINLILIAIGLVSLFFGIKNKLKYLMVIGAVFLAFGLFSAFMDYRTYGTWIVDNHRLPFVIDGMMK